MQADISKRLEDKMATLMELLIDDLLEKAKDGTITSAEASNAVRLLKENGITIAITEGTVPQSTMDKLAEMNEEGGSTIPFPKERTA